MSQNEKKHKVKVVQIFKNFQKKNALKYLYIFRALFFENFQKFGPLLT